MTNWNTNSYVGLNVIEAAYYEACYMFKNIIKNSNLKITWGGVTPKTFHEEFYSVIFLCPSLYEVEQWRVA